MRTPGALAFALAALLSSSALATVTVPAIFSDGFVLQDHATYGQRPFVYGYAAADELITVVRQQPDGTNDTFRATADSAGFWIVQCDPDLFAANQNNLTFYIYGSLPPLNTITIYNAAYGDVFLCSGQSNMNECVAGCFDANETMAGHWPFIRLFSVVEAGATTAQRDLAPFESHSETPCSFPQFSVPNSQQRCNSWQTATEPTVIGTFSAHCFYTALELSKQLTGSRVLGMIHSSVSGTPMKLWLPEAALATCDAVHSSGVAGEGARAAAAAAAASRLGAAPIPPGNSTLWNAMIAPISRYTLRGVVWNQGESDGSESLPYFSCLFQALIGSWRQTWRIGDFAWVFAQIGAQDSTKWPAYWPFTTRLAQSAALPARSNLSATNTVGMAVAYDIGDMGSPYPPDHVHSRRKAELGRRTALAMLHVQYAIQYPASPELINLTAKTNWAPPMLSSVTGAPGGATALAFTVADGNGTELRDTADCWECCANARDTVQFGKSAAPGGEWDNATLELQSGTGILLATPTVPGAYTYVRMGAPLWPQCALYARSNGLPVEPFIAPITQSPDSCELAHGEQLPRPIVPLLSSKTEQRRQQLRATHTAARIGPESWTSWLGRPISHPAKGIIAATPPMGYNSWNGLHCNLDDNLIRRTADVLVSSGLAALGFAYLNLDDCWQVDRQPDGTIIADPVRFPYGLVATARYVQSRGLRFGLYTAQREFTCQQRPGSWRFEDVDIDTYCDWGIDYVKTDGCSGRGNAASNVTWIHFREGIDRCVAKGGHPMVLSVESCSDPRGCGVWLPKLANVWRTTGDIQATFASVLSNLDANNKMAAIARPGAWNDADMLQVGNAGLSVTEAKAHFAAWALIASPLLIGTDISNGVDAVTLDILSAPEVIGVSQDPLGVQGVRVSAAAPSGGECWARPLADGTVAALLLNRGLTPANVTCTFSELGLKNPTGAATVRDLEARADLGSFTASYTAHALASHAAMLVKVAQATRV